MKISIVTDEVSADLETALELAAEMDVHAVELRGYGSERVPFFSDYQKQRVKELLPEYGASVVAISPGLFKIPFPSSQRERFPLQAIDAGLYRRWKQAQDLLEQHLHELLPASIQYALEIGAEKILCFGFERGSAPAGPAPQALLETLGLAARECARNGLELLIEVEAGFWADTGRRTAEMIRAISQPGLGVNWDPGNSILAGEIPYPDGYQAVSEYVRHVHFKDVVCGKAGEFEYRVHGDIDWAGQIEALEKDGYDGYLSIEPHMQPKVASVRQLCERLKELIAGVSEPAAKLE